ncbi:MAG: LLM class flavin-dependent oxidoreductase [Dehalococcoidia bacterium]|nr:LLM class flavin-dependent oxidoreductase [Dehalococcoidia bacterium]
MEIGLALPTSTPNPRGDRLLEFARIADQGGLDSVWSIDRLVFPTAEALVTLAAAGAVTTRVKLGTDVLISTTREPVQLAAQVATIDTLSNGRMLLGVGVGSRAEDYTAAGRDFHTRGRRMEQDVATMRRVWAGEAVVDGFGPAGPRPVQPTIPILFGGSSDAALARGARLGAGHMCIPRGFARQAAMFEKFKAAWTAAGRSERPILYAGGYYCVDPSSERAQERIMAYQAHYYGARQRQSGTPPDPAEFDLAGPAEMIGEAMVAYQGLGVDGLILFPVSDDLAQAEAAVGVVRDAFIKAGGEVTIR